MLKTLAAATLSTAIAFAGLAPTPVRAADAEDLVPLLFGAGILAAIAAASAEASDGNRDRYRRVETRRFSGPPLAHGNPGRASVSKPKSDSKSKRKTSRKVLPAQCGRSIRTQNGWRSFMMRGCLQNTGVRLSSLPRRCERRIDIPGRKRDRTGWNRSCLVRSGYTIR